MFHFKFRTKLKLIMRSLDLNSMFINIPQKKSLTFALISYFKDIDSFENFNKTNLLLHWETKESHSIFNKTSFKRVDGVGKGSHLGNTSPNVFLTFHQKQCLKVYPIDTKFAFYRHYFQYIFVLFKLPEYLLKFWKYLNSKHFNMSLWEAWI